MPKTESVTVDEQRKRVEAASAGAEPAANSPADLGYTEKQWRDFTPEQRRALRKVYDEIEQAKFALAEKREAQEEAIEAAKDAKEEVTKAREALNDLREQAEDIAAGRTNGELPGMDNAAALGVNSVSPTDSYDPAEPSFNDLCTCEHPRLCHQGVNGEGDCLQDGCKCQRFALRPADTAPAADNWQPDEEILEKARQFVARCAKKGKGLSIFGTAKSLFNSSTKLLQESARNYLVLLEREGLIAAAGDDEGGKPMWFPVDPKDGE